MIDRETNDVFDELRFGAAAPEAARSSSGPETDTANEPALLRELGFDPVSLDVLCARTGYSAADLQAKLLELELDGSVARLPGGLFQRVTLG